MYLILKCLVYSRSIPSIKDEFITYLSKKANNELRSHAIAISREFLSKQFK